MVAPRRKQAVKPRPAAKPKTASKPRPAAKPRPAPKTKTLQKPKLAVIKKTQQDGWSPMVTLMGGVGIGAVLSWLVGKIFAAPDDVVINVAGKTAQVVEQEEADAAINGTGGTAQIVRQEETPVGNGSTERLPEPKQGGSNLVNVDYGSDTNFKDEGREVELKAPEAMKFVYVFIAYEELIIICFPELYKVILIGVKHTPFDHVSLELAGIAYWIKKTNPDAAALVYTYYSSGEGHMTPRSLVVDIFRFFKIRTYDSTKKEYYNNFYTGGESRREFEFFRPGDKAKIIKMIDEYMRDKIPYQSLGNILNWIDRNDLVENKKD